jgi:hypothetical protein
MSRVIHRLSAALFAVSMLMTLQSVVQQIQLVHYRPHPWTDQQAPARRQASESSPIRTEVSAASVEQRLRSRGSAGAAVPAFSSDALPASSAGVPRWVDTPHGIPASHQTPLRI